MAVAIGLAEMPLQPLNQRARGLARSIVDLVGLAGHPDGLVPANTSLDGAMLVVCAVLGTVDVAYVDFKTRKPVFEPRETFAQLRFDPLGNVFRTHDRTVGIELELHWGMLLSIVVFSLIRDGEFPAGYQRNRSCLLRSETPLRFRATHPSMSDPVTILVDADACPVKDEIYRVAQRHRAHVRVVSNSPFRVPVSDRVKRVLVDDGFDAADNWIAENAGQRSVVITGDILLAERCIAAGAQVLAHNGKPFDAASIGSAVAVRAIMEDLRAGMDGIGGGPPPFSKADRSRFLQSLDSVLVKLGR